jgi:hypothetical protein
MENVVTSLLQQKDLVSVLLDVFVRRHPFNQPNLPSLLPSIDEVGFKAKLAVPIGQDLSLPLGLPAHGRHSNAMAPVRQILSAPLRPCVLALKMKRKGAEAQRRKGLR